MTMTTCAKKQAQKEKSNRKHSTSSGVSRKKRFSMRKFKKWLVTNGAVSLKLTNPYEILRVETSLGLLVAYKNKAGKQTWPVKLLRLRFNFLKDRAIPSLTPTENRRSERFPNTWCHDDFVHDIGGWGAADLEAFVC